MSTVTLLPNGAGDETSIDSQTPGSGEHWDKLLTSDGDTTKVHTISASWQTDLYTIDSTAVTGSISSIRLYVGVKAVDPDPDESNLIRIIKTHGIVYESAEVWLAYALGQWVGWIRTWSNNPLTNAAWRWSEIENLQIGASIRNPLGEVAITAVSLRVTYTARDPGYIWAGDTKFHWTDERGQEKKIKGTALATALAGHLFVESISLHYVDENGRERRQWGKDTGFNASAGSEGQMWIDDMWIYYVDSNLNIRKLGTWILGSSTLGVDTILHA